MADPFVRSVLLKRDEVPDFGSYRFSIPASRTLEQLELHPEVTFLTGENGSGKSTLVEAIAVAAGFNAEGGSRHMTVSTRASHSESPPARAPCPWNTHAPDRLLPSG